MRNIVISGTLITALAGFYWPAFAQSQQKAYSKELILMGSRFEFTAVSDNEAMAWKSIEAGIAEVRRIEKLISEWDSGSETSGINRNAGKQALQVNPELFELIRRSIKVSRLTGGAFDISFASIDKIWRFDGSMNSVPDSGEVAKSVSKIGFGKIILDPDQHSVFLKEEGMKIGFGAIGKGYAANRARDVMKQMGIEGGIVNAGGDLITWGKDEKGKEWEIAIADPMDKTKMIAWLPASDMAVVTSGDYEKFAEINGLRYAHIIDPRTGYPARGLTSVTIVCPDAELADALATAVFVLGEKEGIALINQLKGIECLVVNDKHEIKTSDNLELNYYGNEK